MTQIANVYTISGSLNFILLKLKLTLAARDVSGYSVRFQHFFLILAESDDPKSSVINLSCSYRSSSA